MNKKEKNRSDLLEIIMQSDVYYSISMLRSAAYSDKKNFKKNYGLKLKKEMLKNMLGKVCVYLAEKNKHEQKNSLSVDFEDYQTFCEYSVEATTAHVLLTVSNNIEQEFLDRYKTKLSRRFLKIILRSLINKLDQKY